MIGFYKTLNIDLIFNLKSFIALFILENMNYLYLWYIIIKSKHYQKCRYTKILYKYTLAKNFKQDF